MKVWTMLAGVLSGCCMMGCATPPAPSVTETVEIAVPSTEEILQQRAALTYTLELEENFDGETLASKRWSRIGRGGADWDRHMSLRPDLVEVKDGQCHLYGKVQEPSVEDPRPMVTGGIKTQGKVTMTYGKVEIRCKLAGQRGAWPAIWMLPDSPTRRWPEGGEIDIIERLNFDTCVYQTVHSKWTQKHSRTPLWSRHPETNPDTWNVYGLEWTPDALLWTINGEVTHVYPRCGEDPEQFPWTEPFYLLIDMQLGGAWVGDVDLTTLPTAMHVDWVKFYSVHDNGKPLGNVSFE